MDRSSDTGLVRAARWLETNAAEYGPTLSVAVAGLGWTLARTFITEPPVGESWPHTASRWALGIILTFLALGGAILAYKRNGSIKNLKKENANLGSEIKSLEETISTISSLTKDVWKSRLGIIASELGLDNTFRLNIYRYSPETKTFSMIGRYAGITKYNHVGRGIYPSEVGCIGAAWESPTLEAIEDDLPEDEDAYIAESCNKWKFDPDTVKNLSMKSRSVYAFTITDALEMDRMAVIVFESTNPKASDADLLRHAVRQRYRKQILSDLAILKAIEPSQTLAQNAGF